VTQKAVEIAATKGQANHNFRQMETRVDELAKLLPPEKTLLYVTGWAGRRADFVALHSPQWRD
jgi:hypothetical protein